MSNSRIYFLMVLAALFWSGAFVAGKLSVQEFPPVSLTFFRFIIALPFIFFILKRQQPGNWAPARAQWPPLIFLGIIGTFLYHVLFFSCLKYTTATNSAIIGSALPMITTLITVLFLHEKTSLLRTAGIITAFFGVLLTITSGDLQVLTTLQFNTGDIIMLLAVICWAVYMALSRRFMQTYGFSPLMLTAYTFLVCTVASAVFVPLERPLEYLPGTTLKGWVLVMYMAVFPSVLGYLIQLTAVQKIGAPKTSVFVNLVPVFTIILSLIVLGEKLVPFKLMSAFIIIAGVYITNRPEKNTGQKGALEAVSRTSP